MNNNNIIGILGKSIQYSLSPIIHKYWLEKFLIKGKYNIYDVEEKDLEIFIKELSIKNILGLNITIPYKKTILNYLDEMTPHAKIIGAVNTIKIQNNGRIYGDNTDAYGFLNHLNNIAPQWKEKKGGLTVLGAGGAARAVIWSFLNKKKNEIRLVNRNQERALSLISDMKKFYPKANIVYYSNYDEALKGSSILVNTTSLGMLGRAELNINLEIMNKNSIVYDIVYSPLNTALLIQAKRLNFLTIDGLGMLLEQAAPAFNLWFNKKAIVNSELRKAIINYIQEKKIK